MKKLVFVLASLFCISFCQAQDTSDDTFNRKGRILLEHGYGLISGFSQGSGLSILVDDDGESITSIGFDGGYFLSQDFALTFNLSVLSVEGGSINGYGAGGKYYAGGKVPISFGGQLFSIGGDSSFVTNLGVGYAFNLADNITLEPNISALVEFRNGSGLILDIGAKFSMFL